MTDICYSPRPDLGILRVAGSDARRFLHAQTTQNIAELETPAVTPAAWLTARGRVRALFDVIPDQDAFWLVTPGDNCDWLAGELGRFVLRADVTLTPATDLFVASVTGDTATWLSGKGIDLGMRQTITEGGLVWVRSLPERIDVIGRADSLESTFAELDRESIEPALAAAITAGYPAVTAALRDRYIPQMLNLDLLGGVSFDKGCYPGQEIVARATNLGQVKRRLRRFRVGGDARPEPGAGIVDADGAAAGDVNRTAARDGGFELLAVVTLDKATGSLSLADDGRRLEALPLPFDDPGN